MITQTIARGLSEKLTWWDQDIAQSLDKSVELKLALTEDTSIQYFDNLNLARQLLYEELNEEIISDSIRFWDFEIDENENNAAVAATVQYDYRVFSHTLKEYDDRSETKRYTYQYVKSKDSWELKAQKTDDPWLSESTDDIVSCDWQCLAFTSKWECDYIDS